MSASPFTPTHGSVLRSLKPCREHVTVRICVGTRGRAHRHIIGFNRPSTTNLARTQSIVEVLPLGNGKTAGRLRGGPVLGVCLPASPRRGNMLSGFCNFLFRSRVQACKQARGVLRVFLSPSQTLSFAASHGQIKAWSRKHEAQRKRAAGAKSYE